MEQLTQDELAAVRKFFRLLEGRFDAYDTGIIGLSDSDILLKKWDTEYSYGDTFLSSDENYLPLLCVTDPNAYDRQLEQDRLERKRAEEQRRAEHARAIREQELATLRALTAKYGQVT